MSGIRRAKGGGRPGIEERSADLGERSRRLAEGVVRELATWFSHLPHHLDRYLEPEQLAAWAAAMTEYFEVPGVLECHFGQKGQIEVVETDGEPLLKIVCRLDDASVFLPVAGGAHAYPPRGVELHLVAPAELDRVLRAWIRPAA